MHYFSINETPLPFRQILHIKSYEYVIIVGRNHSGVSHFGIYCTTGLFLWPSQPPKNTGTGVIPVFLTRPIDPDSFLIIVSNRNPWQSGRFTGPGHSPRQQPGVHLSRAGTLLGGPTSMVPRLMVERPVTAHSTSERAPTKEWLMKQWCRKTQCIGADKGLTFRRTLVLVVPHHE